MDPKVIVITGCSSGIGYDAALTLAKRGHRVIASCRKITDVNRLLDLNLEALCLDVNDSNSIQKGFETILNKTNGRLDVLINNAGYGQSGALEDISRDVLRHQFETNVFGLHELSRLVIPIMRKQGSGRIINFSSLLGFVSMKFRGAYNASKYAVEGLSDTLRLELAPFGIHVITMEPGPIHSKFRENAVDVSLRYIDIEHSDYKNDYKYILDSYREEKSDSIFTLKTDAVIKKLIHAIESKRPKPKYLVTFPTYVFAACKRLLTTKMLDRLLSYISSPNSKSS